MKRSAGRPYLSGAVRAVHLSLLLQRCAADEGKRLENRCGGAGAGATHTENISIQRAVRREHSRACPGTAVENLISPNPHQGTPSCRLTTTLIINYTISMGISTKQSYKS